MESELLVISLYFGALNPNSTRFLLMNLVNVISVNDLTCHRDKKPHVEHLTIPYFETPVVFEKMNILAIERINCIPMDIVLGSMVCKGIGSSSHFLHIQH